MDLNNLLDNVIAYARNYPLIAGVIALLLMLLIWRNRKESLKLVVFVLFMVAILYALSYFGGTLSSGVKHKDEMIYKTRDALK